MIATYAAYEMVASQSGKPMSQLILNDVVLSCWLNAAMHIAPQLPYWLLLIQLWNAYFLITKQELNILYFTECISMNENYCILIDISLFFSLGREWQ